MDMVERKDLFGDRLFQGSNYAKFRPNYPDEFYKTIYEKTTERENYIDIGCGTGQLYFQIQQEFSGYRIGADLSDVQLEQARMQLDSLNNAKCLLIKSDDHSIAEVLRAEHNLDIKFDLVTVGQALHWFDVPRFFAYTKEKLFKSDNSVLAVVGYIPESIELDTESIGVEISESRKELVRNCYTEYYEETKRYYENDQDNMHGYIKYMDLFDEHFSRVQKDQLWLKKKMNDEELIALNQTYSAYATYRKQNSNDPISIMKDVFEQVKSAYGLKQLPILHNIHYFWSTLQK